MKDFQTIFGDFKPLTPTEPVEEIEKELEEEQETEEEQEEESEEEESTEKQEEEQEEDSDEFSFKPILDELSEAGVLSFIEDKEYEDSEEGFQEVIADTVAAKLKEELDAIPEDYRSIMEHLKAGGSLQEWVDKMDPTDFANADLEHEGTQEILVREMFNRQGFSEIQVEKKVTKLKEQGLLDSEAEDAQEYLVASQKKEREDYQKQLEKDNAMRAEQAVKAESQMKADINSFEKLDEIPLTKELKEKLYQYAVVKDKKTGLTAYQKELGSKEGFFASALKTMLGVGKEYVERKATTKATSALKKEFQKRTTSGTPSGKTVTTDIKTSKIPVKGMPWG